MKKKALIIGCNGQDGILLSKLLKSKEYLVYGISHHPEKAVSEIDKYRSFDLNNRDYTVVERLIQSVQPDELYYLAAFHFSSQDSTNVDSDHILTSAMVNYIGFQNICEICNGISSHTKISYTSSSLIYSGSKESFLSEKSPKVPGCYYSLHKNSSMISADYFRDTHNLFITVGIMFNHESVYRKRYYLSKRIVNQVRSFLVGDKEKIVVGDLDAVTDWSSAYDLTRALWHVQQLQKPDTYIMSSGKGHRVRDWFLVLEEYLNKDLMSNVETDSQIVKRVKPTLVGDNSKLVNTGWIPSMSFSEMVIDLYDRSYD